jgi:ankyrin repeat protein
MKDALIRYINDTTNGIKHTVNDKISSLVVEKKEDDDAYLLLCRNDDERLSKEEQDGYTTLLYETCGSYDEELNDHDHGLDSILDCVQFLLEKKANVNMQVANSMVPLYIAATSHWKITELLIQAKAYVNIKTNHQGCTPLIIASEDGYTKSVELLINAKADVNALSHTTNALISAASFGHTEIVKLLINAKANVNESSVNDGLTALFLSMEHHDHETSRLLLEANANPLICSRDGVFPIERLLFGCSDEVNYKTIGDPMTCIKLLLKYGSHPEILYNSSKYPESYQTAIFSVCYGGDPHIFSLLLNEIDNNSNYNSEDKHKLLHLEHTGFKVTPLEIAAEKNNSECVKLLIKHNVDIDMKSTENGNTAIMTAMKRFSDESVMTLFNVKADMTIHNNDGESAIDVLRKLKTQVDEQMNNLIN